MGITKIINGKENEIANKSIIDHSQLSGTKAYGCHPISAIRNLPEKLTALKQKDKELEDKIGQHDSEVDEQISNLQQQINTLKANDVTQDEDIATLTEELGIVEESAKQIDITTNPDSTFTFTNYNGEEKVIQSGFLPDEKSLILTDNKMALNNDNETIKVITKDEQTKVRATGLYNETTDAILTPKEIDDRLDNLEEQLVDDVNDLQDQINDINTKDLKQDEEMRNIKSRIKGIGGYLNAYDFGTADPTSEELTDYALSQISGIDNITQIYDQTKVKNEYNGHIWVLNHEYDDSGKVINSSWADNGTEYINTATNTGVQGIVTGSYDQWEGAIDILGRISINGLEEFANNTDTSLGELNNEINQVKQNYVPKTTTIAGKPLSNNVNLSTLRVIQDNEILGTYDGSQDLVIDIPKVDIDNKTITRNTNEQIQTIGITNAIDVIDYETIYKAITIERS